MTEAVHTQEAANTQESLLLRIVRRFADSRELTLLILVAALALAMSIAYPNNFPTGSNLRAVLLNLAPVGILVCGMMLLMIAGSFDLSCGSTLALAGVWAGVVAGWWGWPAEVAILVGIELKVITATVLGGASLKGGEGTIIGGILGVLFIALIENAMIINAIGVFWQGMVVGLVLLFAVSLDRFKSSGRV